MGESVKLEAEGAIGKICRIQAKDGGCLNLWWAAVMERRGHNPLIIIKKGQDLAFWGKRGEKNLPMATWSKSLRWSRLDRVVVPAGHLGRGRIGMLWTLPPNPTSASCDSQTSH